MEEGRDTTTTTTTFIRDREIFGKIFLIDKVSKVCNIE